ncbi:phosphoserine transaminase [Lichenicola cladoniae]|uniref:phosphoserine transaminase n=1 Tax=Lichenicola cladoniae TaxID=1484109 RepID=A0A6M8HQS7_9PROT|nr:phosphoserine transaminase [Lichenicola cladoniae]NPD68773.1 phosphoserine transaminase [Acetobacteraceae bacterium]QKE90804.1 phosphoserine transaminase [Lichenicola cladoniae]
MISPVRPSVRPANPCFSSGPCAKRPGWSLDALSGALLGRSHRATDTRASLAEVIDRSRALLGLPAGWRLGIVPGSDTGAVEMVLWSLLGTRPVDVLSFESFSATWAHDIVAQLQLADARVLEAEYGALPDLASIDWSHDVVFAWNGTTSGACFAGADSIPAVHDGLAICDATSAAFAMALPWDRLDVVTWSWQKVLGGEAAHGMLALSPRAVARLEATPALRPLPKLFRLTAKGRLIEGIFKGDTINTPSMLCVEDALDGLRWAERIGGLDALIARSRANLAAVADWESRSDWASFLAPDPSTRSSTSICLRLTADWFLTLPAATQAKAHAHLVSLLQSEGAALDVGSYRDAPAGLRIWGGATVETSDIEAALPWFDWAAASTRAAFA